jgi:hypothetical protein
MKNEKAMKNIKIYAPVEERRRNIVNFPAGFCRDRRQMVDRISWNLPANRHI